jgi:periplasmic divalent cation tolerance protein
MKFVVDLCEVTITAPDTGWLTSFTKRLVADRLCAAVHRFEPIQSTYWWQGEICQATEVRVALHTRRSLVSQIIDRTNREHPYEVPCVTVQSITDGNHVYLAWIARETQVHEEGV